MQRKPLKQLLLLVLAGSWALGASAQWQWIDKDGRKVFSDRPPPQDVPEKNVLKQPTLRATAPTPMPPAQAPATAASLGAPEAGAPTVDKQLQDKKAQAEAAEAARKQAEEKTQAQQQAKARAENCARARQSSNTLSSGMPLAHINDKGERGYMDEATRSAELRRAQEIIARDCK
ncbi:DUF4124 domain-containing protein [Melaminivora suipulveris]|uniref:DUF4124 domain-containing protein n=1 Tax=Melaminivora suipulveris TaxID=2109913 RepID=A0A2R3QF47_9BURK|nr:DUF4124 domain-containing protein [Melaminivora suipulveris]AVO50401.1 DUF4124 domain-containing protein [Melaminivora suipulveris]